MLVFYEIHSIQFMKASIISWNALKIAKTVLISGIEWKSDNSSCLTLMSTERCCIQYNFPDTGLFRS